IIRFYPVLRDSTEIQETAWPEAATGVRAPSRDRQSGDWRSRLVASQSKVPALLGPRWNRSRAGFCSHLQADLRAFERLFRPFPVHMGVVWRCEALLGALQSRLRAWNVNLFRALRPVRQHNHAIAQHFHEPADRRTRKRAVTHVIAKLSD